MDAAYMGKVIRGRRLSLGMTQRRLAEKLHVSDKAVSKWERGSGCPDLSVLPALSAVLEVDLAGLLSGEMPVRPPVAGNLRRTRVYVCPVCGNLLFSAGESSVSCCGLTLSPEAVHKPDDAHRLQYEVSDGELLITSSHEMRKEHSLTFMAYLSGDTLLVKKLYPEWGVSVRLPYVRMGSVLWYCSRDGLFSEPVPRLPRG